MARSRLHKRYGSQPRHNPPLLTDLAEFALPGFAGFAGSRFLTRVAATQVEQRFPTWGKHAGAVASVGAFLASWFLAHKWKWLEKYHTPIVVGSAIATLQSLIQLYLPSMGWMVSDATPELASAAASQLDASQMPAPHLNLQPMNVDPNEYTYDDRYDAGRFSPVHHPHASGAQADAGTSTPTDQSMSEDDLAINDAIGQSANLGVFQN